MHSTAVVSYGGGERWRWSERRRERERWEKLSVTMAARFFLPACERCAFVNGAGCTADIAALSWAGCPFCCSEDSLLCEHRDKRANNCCHQFTVNNKSCTHSQIQIRQVCCLYWKHTISILPDNNFSEILSPVFSPGFHSYSPDLKVCNPSHLVKPCYVSLPEPCQCHFLLARILTQAWNVCRFVILRDSHVQMHCSVNM